MKRLAISATVLLATAATLRAAPPPLLVSYQGLLRGSTGLALNGPHNMIFRFFDAPAAGNEIINDAHLGAGAVVVNNGLFDVLLGGGIVADGAGPGVFVDLGTVFRTFTNVWLQIEINGEILNPRIRIGSVGHALNAAYAESVGGVNSGQFLRSDTSDQFTSGTLTINAGTTLDVAGTLEATSLLDRDNTLYYVDPASIGTSLNIAGDISLDTGMGIFATGEMYLGGTNADIHLGDTTPDRVFIYGNDLYMHSLDASTSNTEVDQIIYFYEDGLLTGESFRWDNASDRFELTDDLFIGAGDLFVDKGSGLNSRLFFSNDTDDEIGEIIGSGGISIRLDKDNDESGGSAGVFVISANGLPGTPLLRLQSTDEANLELDAGVTSNAFDFAEAFKTLGEQQNLEPGDVVSFDHNNAEHCRRAVAAYDVDAIGVISTKPAYTCGMSFDAIDEADPELAAQRDAALARGDKKEASRLDNLLQEKMQRIWKPVAQIGRVPCKVDGRFGKIKAGDRLASSTTAGHAMKMTRNGMSIGVAMQDFDGEGTGTIMVFVRPGYYGGFGDQADAGGIAKLQEENAALRTRLEALEAAVARLSK